MNKVHSIKPISQIPGMFEFDIPVHTDSRGWFKENWQKEKFEKLGLDFTPVQNNVSYNTQVGVTRGIHAEPWNKLVSVLEGKVFGAWVDLREGESFGSVYYTEITPEKALFIPKGVANSYQTLTETVVYSYLVDAHWSPDAKYKMLNLADETVNIPWPISLDKAEISEKDFAHPRLSDIKPFSFEKKVLIIGSGGQLGSELVDEFPDATAIDYPELDLSDKKSLGKINFSDFDVVINAAAMTDVDGAETNTGRKKAWAINCDGIRNLVCAVSKTNATLVHISSDYVFDGEISGEHSENENFSPLNVYGQTKAVGDELVSTIKNHYILRTSWVVGNGKNFVKTMATLAEKGIEPEVIDDQIGRLTFTSELTHAIKHLLKTDTEFGTYNISNDGKVSSWFDIAKFVYEKVNSNLAVKPISTDDYFAKNSSDDKKIADRPKNSALDLSKIKKVGFLPKDWQDSLDEYLKKI